MNGFIYWQIIETDDLVYEQKRQRMNLKVLKFYKFPKNELTNSHMYNTIKKCITIAKHR